MSSTSGTSSTARKTQRFRGNVPGINIGDAWDKRVDMFHNGLHVQIQAGIDGRPDSGCYSVVLSAGYEDDEDHGDEIIYTGCGGQDEKKVQCKDQEFTGKNASLVVSCNEKTPVRVIRGFNCRSPYAPERGYRYDGLYQVVEFWSENKRGFNMCRYRMKRLPDQPPLTKRENNPAKRVKRAPAIKSGVNAQAQGILQGDMDFMKESIESMAQQATQDYCAVCESLVPGLQVGHVEAHVQGLWDHFDAYEKEILAMRGMLNADRIESLVDALLSEDPIYMPASSSFVWP